MKTKILTNNNRIDYNFCSVIQVIQHEDCIEFKLISDELDSEYKYILIAENHSFEKVNFNNKITIQISGEIEVFCEDWMEDENIPKSSLDESWMRWNDVLGIMEFNHERIVGSDAFDLPFDFIRFLDLEFASVEKIFFDKNFQDGKFVLILNAHYNDPHSQQTMGYYTGPFRFYCKDVKLSID